MAKRSKSRAKRKPGSATPVERAPKPPAPNAQAPTQKQKPKPAAVREPAFWFGFEITWAKLALARTVLFGLLAVDALMQIRHAPRYGAGGFNVAQIPLLDALGPTRTLYAGAELVNAYLFVLAALGVGTRFVIPAAAAIYSWLYFGSQLDSYQHHYLVALVLVLACFVPWQRPEGATPATPVRSWAVRLILVQLAIMYLWAAVSKMNAAWVDGRTLSGQIGGVARDVVDATIGTRGAARITIGIELALASTVWLRPAWRFAAPLGLVFHAGILMSTLEIGLFAWLMLGIYVLVVPDRIWVWLAESPPLAFVRARAAAIAPYAEGPLRWVALGLALVAGLVLAGLVRFEHALAIGAALAAVPIAAAVRVRPRLAAFAAAHVIAFATWIAVDRASAVAFDYYRLWGGTSRRLGDADGAERAYRGMAAVDPLSGPAHYRLGLLLLARGAEEEALAELHAAQLAEPSLARSFIAEARYLADHNRREAALDKARGAVDADATDPEARALLANLESGANLPRVHGGDDAEDSK